MEFIVFMLYQLFLVVCGYYLHDMANYNRRDKQVVKAYNVGYTDGMKTLGSILETLEKNKEA